MLLKLSKKIKKIKNKIIKKVAIYNFKENQKNTLSSKVFILGHQKSGTTVIAALIAEMSGFSLTNDIHRSHKDSQSYRAAHFCSKEQQNLIDKYSYEISKDIVKEPELSFFYRSLKNKYINAQFIYISRSPKYIIRSILSRLGAQKSSSEIYSDTFKKNLKRAPLWQDIIGYSSGNNIIEHLAHRIEKLDSLYLNNEVNLHLLKYENFITDKTNSLSLLLNDLNIKKINDASHLLNKQFQPKSISIKPDEYFTKAELELIDKICVSYTKI